MRAFRVAVVSAIIGGGIMAFAVDYNAMSIDELNSMRGTNLPTEERAAFQEAYKAKVQALPAEEQSKYMGRPQNAPERGTGTGQGADSGSKGSGGGAGNSGKGNGGGQGNGGGKGNGRN